MTAPAATEQQPCHVHCTKCKHDFVACWLPMEVRLFVDQLRAMICPVCKAPTSDIAMGKSSQADHSPSTTAPHGSAPAVGERVS